MSDPSTQSRFSPFTCNITHKLFKTVEWYTMENPMSDLYFLTIYASLWASEHTEYHDQQNAVQDGKVDCDTTECTMAFLCSDHNFSLPDTV